MPTIWQQHLAPFSPHLHEATLPPVTMGRTGIIADSHGHVQRLSAAIDFLNAKNCLRIIHLGDICDSTAPQTVDACVSLMQKNTIPAVRGNNDHTLSLNYAGRTDGLVSADSVNYLHHLPLLLKDRRRLFTHSLPFVEALGLSSMVGRMTAKTIVRFFNTFPNAILFRGHSHSPEVIRPAAPHFTRRPLLAGQTFDLNPAAPVIFTCGALTQGHCLIIEPDNTLICHCF